MYIPLSLYLSIYLPIYSSIHLSIYLPIHPSIHLSVHLSVHLSLSLSLSLKIAIWILWHFVCSPPTHYPWVIYGQPGSIRLKLLDHPRPEMKDPWQQRPEHGITGFTVSRFHGFTGLFQKEFVFYIPIRIYNTTRNHLIVYPVTSDFLTMMFRLDWNIVYPEEYTQIYRAQDIGWAKHANLRPVIAALTGDGQ